MTFPPHTPINDPDSFQANGIEVSNIKCVPVRMPDGRYVPEVTADIILLNQPNDLTSLANVCVTIDKVALSGLTLNRHLAICNMRCDNTGRLSTTLPSGINGPESDNWHITGLSLNNSPTPVTPFRLTVMAPPSEVAKVLLGNDAYEPGTLANQRLLAFRRLGRFIVAIPGVRAVTEWGFNNLDEPTAGIAREMGFVHPLAQGILNLPSNLKRISLENARTQMRRITQAIKTEFGCGS